jgi:DNA-directed RNA polymerase subunit RPC12/RpoP
MTLKVLCAGCSKDERELAESTVRRTLGKRVVDGAWTVSLVGTGDKWSITLDAPAAGIRSRTFLVARDQVGQALLEALGPAAGSAPAAAPAPAPAPLAEARSPAQCERCHQAFVVAYESTADEGQEAAPVACPHCWHVNRVLVGERAAETREYRADKA